MVNRWKAPKAALEPAPLKLGSYGPTRHYSGEERFLLVEIL
jgi:hypothetical protein